MTRSVSANHDSILSNIVNRKSKGVSHGLRAIQILVNFCSEYYARVGTILYIGTMSKKQFDDRRIKYYLA
jgi:hypothetical protein